MAVKYQCPKCDKRFVDWGAEKLGFKCPDCDETLVRAGSQPAAASAPTLKRRAKKAAAVRVATPVAPDLDLTPTGEEDVETESEEVEEVVFGDVAVADDEDDAAVIIPAAADDEDADEIDEAHGEETPEVLDFDADAAPLDDALVPEFEEEH